MFLKEFVKFLESETSFVLRTNLFKNFVPQEAPDRSVVVRASGGSGEHFTRSVFEGRVQVVVRSEDDNWAETAAGAIYELLHGRSGVELPQVDTGPIWRAESITGITMPQPLGRDQNERFMWSVNFAVKLKKEVE